jgi:DNA-binding NtrC family response regulator
MAKPAHTPVEAASTSVVESAETRQVLIVDDDRDVCAYLAALVQAEGFAPLVAYEGAKGLTLARARQPDVVISDFVLPDMNGMDILRGTKRIDEDIPVIMVTGHASVATAVEAIRAGAHDYLTKPFSAEEVIRVVRRALSESDLRHRIKDLSSQIKQVSSLREVMGPSDAVGQIITQVNRVAASSFTVVILGETGSGKEVVARAIHEASPRIRGPFVAVDCGAIPETLFETELFGHEKGAFTGAESQRGGKFEAAKGGTLFLDEILNMPLGCQAKLLRALQDKTYYRVGGTKPLTSDFRLLVASNRDLLALCEAGTFRTDLYFRLNEFAIAVPPLKQRKEDVLYLAKRFLDITSFELRKHVEGFTESAVEALLTYDWPGNVRQLRSTIRRAVLLAQDRIGEEHLDIKRIAPMNGARPSTGVAWTGQSLRDIVKTSTASVERDVIAQSLTKTNGNKAAAARLLQIDYKTMLTKMKEYGL